MYRFISLLLFITFLSSLEAFSHITDPAFNVIWYSEDIETVWWVRGTTSDGPLEISLCRGSCELVGVVPSESSFTYQKYAFTPKDYIHGTVYGLFYINITSTSTGKNDQTESFEIREGSEFQEDDNPGVAAIVGPLITLSFIIICCVLICRYRKRRSPQPATWAPPAQQQSMARQPAMVAVSAPGMNVSNASMQPMYAQQPPQQPMYAQQPPQQPMYAQQPPQQPMYPQPVYMPPPSAEGEYPPTQSMPSYKYNIPGSTNDPSAPPGYY